jgi:hypothetical protein
MPGWNVLKVLVLDRDLTAAPALLLPIPVDGPVDGHPGEPGPNLGAGVDPLRLLKELDEGILDNLEGILGVSQIAIGDPVEAALVADHE